MGINFEKALGIHPNAINFRAERSKVMASNLANVDTPGYKAKDMDFSTVFGTPTAAPKKMIFEPVQRMKSARTGMNTQYRIPHQPTKDGNTVESGLEMARFSENSMDYQTSLQFLNSKISGLREVIKSR